MTPTCETDAHKPDTPISHLLGQVYEAAPPAEQSRLLEHLLRPLSLLSLAAVANGIFAEIRFCSTWPDLQVRLVEAQNVHVSDVIALVDYVQQVNIESIHAITRMLMPSPLMASSAAALVAGVLMQRVQTHHACGDDQEPEISPAPRA
jgi:hypothetical protein